MTPDDDNPDPRQRPVVWTSGDLSDRAETRPGRQLLRRVLLGAGAAGLMTALVLGVSSWSLMSPVGSTPSKPFWVPLQVPSQLASKEASSPSPRGPRSAVPGGTEGRTPTPATGGATPGEDRPAGSPQPGSGSRASGTLFVQSSAHRTSGHASDDSRGRGRAEDTSAGRGRGSSKAGAQDDGSPRSGRGRGHDDGRAGDRRSAEVPRRTQEEASHPTRARDEQRGSGRAQHGDRSGPSRAGDPGRGHAGDDGDTRNGTTAAQDRDGAGSAHEASGHHGGHDRQGGSGHA